MYFINFVVWTVRQKAKELVEFVQDDDRVRDERRKAKKTKDKYIGMAGEAMNRQYSTFSIYVVSYQMYIVLVETQYTHRC